MSAIKRFFEKKKLDVKFKKAGGGKKLTDESRQISPRPSNSAGGAKPMVQTDAQRAAAQAALARMEQPRQGTAKPSMRTHIRSEVEAEMKAREKSSSSATPDLGPKEVIKDAAPMISSVKFKCPLVGDVVLPKAEMETYIEDFLMKQLVEEPTMASALMIHTLNKDKEKVRIGIETLCKYLDNIISHPGEEKYLKIRINNKAFQERVNSLKGVQEFLQAGGFEIKRLPGPGEDAPEEKFFIMNPERGMDTEALMNFKDLLFIAEPIRPQLDRDMKVFYPSQYANRIEVPPDFYAVSQEEIKREQQARTEAVEKLGMLRTKAMRERDEQRELRKYRYTLLRIRFPDDIILQGIFRALDKLQSVMEFIRENLENDWMPFMLNTSTGQKLTNEECNLAELGLAPAAVLNFTWDAAVLADVQKQGVRQVRHLNDAALAKIENL
ncbi:unnamed protein product [Owenia fusiformis]|uniref:Uncharacterized protein n=1 Tax=Owenia fusiformis TaxID=6347 RepID=A0A8J1T7I8_OWEFU|nr:unnamed protein product [Owenia fusiformis]